MKKISLVLVVVVLVAVAVARIFAYEQVQKHRSEVARQEEIAKRTAELKEIEGMYRGYSAPVLKQILSITPTEISFIAEDNGQVSGRTKVNYLGQMKKKWYETSSLANYYIFEVLDMNRVRKEYQPTYIFIRRASLVSEKDPKGVIIKTIRVEEDKEGFIKREVISIGNEKIYVDSSFFDERIELNN